MRFLDLRLRLLAIVLLSIVCQQAGAVSLENAHVRIEIDDKARVVAMTNKLWPAFNLIGKPTDGFWRLNLQKGRSLENIVWPKGQLYEVTKAGDVIEVSLKSVKLRGDTLPIQLKFRITLVNDEVHWSTKIDNQSDFTVAEVFLPELGGIAGLGDPELKDDLYWPEVLGRRIANFKQSLTPHQDGLHNLSLSTNRLQDPFLELTYPYPASMSWCTLNNGKKGLYFAAHDGSSLTGAMRAGRQMSEGDGLFFSYVKYPFVGPRETWASSDYITAFYQGDWHVAADKYHAFLSTWRMVRDKPEWVQNMQGMFLVILRQQYGDVLWQYKDIPYLYQEAKRNGLDTLALFGWTEGGHDNQYPEYHPDPAMGGVADLVAGLKTVKEQQGNTILYLQGHLIDPTTPEYPDASKTFAARNIWGTPYHEEYSKASESSFLRNYSHKTFTPSCPDIPGWAELLQQKGSDTLKLGPTGVIYDQIGGMPAYPCFNPGLHEKPAEAFIHGRLHLLEALRTNLKKQRSDTGFMAEHTTDVFSQYLDIVHCAGRTCAYDPDAFPELFRYTVPDVILTTRHPATRPEQRQVNYAFTYGLRFELEVRYRDEGEVLRDNVHTEMSDYLRNLAELRRRHWPQLGTGTFLNTSQVAEANQNVTIALFGSGQQRAIVLWNNSASPQSVDPALEGFRFVVSDGINGTSATGSSTLQPQEVRVWIFESRGAV